MNKDNKYYEIIENLVKQHRKYSEYEAILEDIIDDVYSHSEVIINSITNESVIEAYLQKVINTSMITVPKKLGVRKYVRQAAAEPVQIQEQVASVDERIDAGQDFVPVEETNEIKVNTELVDKMINLAETPKEDFSEQVDDDFGKNDAEMTFSAEEESSSDGDEVFESILSEDVNANDLCETDLDNQAGSEELQPEETDEIFGNQDDIAEPDETENVQEEETVLSAEVLPEDDGLGLSYEDIQEAPEEDEEPANPYNEDNVLEIDESANENTVSIDFVLPQDENSLELTDISEDFLEENNDVEEAESLEILDAEEDSAFYTEKEPQESNEEFLDVQNEMLTSENIDIDDFSETTEEDLSEFSVGEDLLISNSDDGLEIEENAESILEEVEPAQKTEATPISTIDYSVFAPSDDIYSDITSKTDDLDKEILDLDNKYSRLNIINVFNLRYKHNYSVDRISQELNMETADVYLALSKISDVV